VKRSLVARIGLLSSFCVLPLSFLGCTPEKPPALPPPTMAIPSATPPHEAPDASEDPLGPRPHVAQKAAFKPDAPKVMPGPNGLTIWLVQRHELPLVAATLVIPHGSASDPAGKGGLAAFTANMLDEGAGKLRALDISRQIDLLGADLQTGAAQDYSYVSLRTLKKNLGPAFSIFADVATKPTFSDAEGKRVHDLWENDLKSRGSDPQAVSSIVCARALFGAEHPYGHPSDGTTKSAKAVSLADARAFHARMYRPDQAILVLVGDLSEAEAADLAKARFSQWSAPKTAAPEIVAPSAPAPLAKTRVVLVDRPDAPQSVISVVKPGLAMSATDFPPLGRVNAALGGSFTSRLNQDLREDHGWTYGAKSRFSFTRGTGLFVASAAVFTDKTPDALAALVADVNAYAAEGPTREESDKTRLLLRAELVESYEGVSGIAQRLGRQAALGLPPDYDEKASITRDAAHKDDLAALAKKYLGGPSLIVVVGPKSKVEAGLGAKGFGGFEVVLAEEP
jgi:predicted Zn-dependent peptidase